MKPFLIGLAGWLSTVALACGQLPLTERITAKFGERVAELQLRLGEEAFPAESRPEVEQRIVTVAMTLEFDSDRLWRVTFNSNHKLAKPLIAFAEEWRNFGPIGELKIDRMTMRGEFQRYLDAWKERAGRAGKREGVDYWIRASKSSTTDQVTIALEPRRRVVGTGTLTSDSWRFEFTTETNLRYNPDTVVGKLDSVMVTADTFSTRARAEGGGVVSSTELAKPRGPGVTLEDGTHLAFGHRLDDAADTIGARVSDARGRGARRGLDQQISLTPYTFYFDTGRLSRVVYNRFDGPIAPFPEEWKNFSPIGEQRFKPGLQPGEFALYLHAWEEREKAAGRERGKDFAIRELSEPGGIKTTEVSFPPQSGAAWGDEWRIMFRETGTPPDRRMELFGVDALRGEFNTRPQPGLDRRAKAIQDGMKQPNLPGVEVPKVEIAPIGGESPEGRAIRAVIFGSTKARGVYLALALATIVVGLLVHRRIVPLGPVARDVVGDALWAGMIVWWLGAAWPAARARSRAIVAFGVCIAVELSQLYDGPPLAALRETRFGHLVLGSGFDPRDLAAYALGAVGAWWLDARWVARVRAG